jgi:hypothetical protein
VFISQTRLYMALVMGAAMAVVVLAFMLGMHPNHWANIGIVAAAAVTFAVTLWSVRSQRTVDDGPWVKAMIPHHRSPS